MMDFCIQMMDFTQQAMTKATQSYKVSLKQFK